MFDVWHAILTSSWLVKLVIIALLIISVLSWGTMFRCSTRLKQCRASDEKFHRAFQTANRLDLLMTGSKASETGHLQGFNMIFKAGFQEYQLLMAQGQQNKLSVEVNHIAQNMTRAMSNAENKVIESLEHPLTFLATVGTTSPYIGLLGTVWGIMHAFQVLGTQSGGVSINMIAPGIAEALVTTALGLLTAIPAVMAYNQYSRKIDCLSGEYSRFQSNVMNRLLRKSC